MFEFGFSSFLTDKICVSIFSINGFLSYPTDNCSLASLQTNALIAAKGGIDS